MLTNLWQDIFLNCEREKGWQLPIPITIVNSLFILWLHYRDKKKHVHKREHGESNEVEKRERKWVNDVNLDNSIASKMGG
jgi:hypothetical protein